MITIHLLSYSQSYIVNYQLIISCKNYQGRGFCYLLKPKTNIISQSLEVLSILN